MSSKARDAPQIIVVRPGALGDTVLSLPLLESILLLHPTAKITFLGTRPYGDIIPKWAEFQPMDHPRWLWLFAPESAESAPNGRSFDTAYLVLNKPDDVIRNLNNARVSSIFLTSSRPEPGEHVVEHMHRGLGLPVPAKAPALSHFASRKEGLIWIHPGSGGPGKCIPLGFLIRFLDALASMKDCPRVITAGEDDAFLKDLPEWNTLMNAPRTRLLEQRPLLEVCTLSSASLFIGNDSGISHLAAALGVPSIVFFTSTDPSQWSPWVPDDQVRVLDVRGEEVTLSAADRLASQVVAFIDKQ
jgi:ADP-heptose:LPS heptosyltransferase